MQPCEEEKGERIRLSYSSVCMQQLIATNLTSVFSYQACSCDISNNDINLDCRYTQTKQKENVERKWCACFSEWFWYRNIQYVMPSVINPFVNTLNTLCSLSPGTLLNCDLHVSPQICCHHHKEGICKLSYLVFVSLNQRPAGLSFVILGGDSSGYSHTKVWLM